ncbi:YadA family autotransporter adhesin, partial [Luteimonas abyssi]|uniref:YadA family autotransporter adhesin n=1 Tax=Luteimonas abyssi TaxID=1247514 RepID=UPI00192E5ACF
APDYALTEVGPGGTLGSGNYADVGGAFGSVSSSLANVAQVAGELDRLAVRYDVDVDGNLVNRVTLTGTGSGAPVGLGNVAAGAVTAVSADAVTGAQLYGANLALAGYLGAGAGLDAAGNVTAPDYVLNEVGVDGTLGSGNYADVGGAFGSVSTSLANVTQITGELDRLAVRYDVDADGELVNRVTLTGDGSGAPVALDNVAAGALTAISAEAVTGAQLYGANLALAGYLGGGAGLDAAGNVTAPTYVLNEVAADGSLGSGSYADVGGAFDSVSASLANVTQAAGELDRLAVRYDVDADGEILNRVTLVGDNTGTPVVVDNVAAAAVTATSAEAVTGAQLYGANVALAGYLGGGASLDADGNVTAPTYVLNEVAVDGSLGSGSYVDVGSAFGSVSASLANVTQTAGELDRRAVRYDIDADGEIVNRVTLTGDGSGAPVALDNVAAGALTAISAEAVTGAQLYGANLVLAGYLGGGASLDADGNVTMPTYVLNEITSTGGTTTGSYTDVGGALDSLSQSLINIDGRTDAVGRLAVRYDADADGNPLNQVTLLGDGTGAPVRLTQLADGAITAISTDAVSGGQLFATHTTLAGFFGGTTGFDGDTGQWSAPVFSITSVALDGGVSATDYANVTDAFAAVDASLVNLNQRIDQGGGPGTGSPYVQVNSTQGAASAVGAESVAIGPQARAEGDGSVALGDGAVAVADNSIALGAGSRAETGAQQGYDGAFVEAGSSNSVGEVSVGSTGAERKITNVADGSGRYDAVNVGQLQGGVDYAIDQSRQYTDQQINNINNGGSGMFRVNDTLDRGNPSASGDDSVAGGAGAVASGGSSTALGNGARAEGANSVALGAGSVATRDNTVSVGSAGNERQITHVADASDAHDAVNLRQLQASEQGSLRYDTRSDGSSDFSSVTLGAPGGSAPVRVRNVAAGVAGTDAVNLNQLNQAMDWSRQYTDDRFDAVQGDIRRIDNRASAGVAAAMAMASLPQPYLPGRSMISVAGGSFNGESSMAVGIAGVSEGGRWIYRLNGSANSRGDGGVSVGAGFQW